MKNSLYLLLAAVLLLGGCKKENSVVKGGISVTIVNEQEQPVEGADVYISPNTQQQTTNAEGVATFSGLDAGTYQISASKSGEGNGIGVAEVISGQVAEVTVPLISGLTLSLAPRIDVIGPDTTKEYRPVDTINFKTTIVDDNTMAENIPVTVTSDIDGVIYSGSVAGTDSCNFSVHSFSKGIHKITIEATDKDNLTSTHSFTLKVTLPAPVELTGAVKQNKQVILNWTECTDAEFLQYEILRKDVNSYEIIATIENKSVVSFTDTAPPLGIFC